jgi:hypothetical protein
VSGARSEAIIDEVRQSVRRWREVAEPQGLSRDEQERMAHAFRLA